MANVKFVQALGDDTYRRLVQQKEASGIQVVTGVDPSLDAVTSDNVIGLVTTVFFLGKKKFDVYFAPKEAHGKEKKLAGQYRFVQAGNVFYLVRKGD